MIEIKAEVINDTIEFSSKISGKGRDIVDEAVEIMVRLPERLIDMDSDLFGIIKDRFSERIRATIAEEETNDRVN